MAGASQGDVELPQFIERLLPSVARLVAQNRSLTDDAAEVLLLAADISPDAELVKELRLWEGILQRGLSIVGGQAGIVITEALRLRGLREEGIQQALRLLSPGVGTDAAIRGGGNHSGATQETTGAAPDPRIESLVAQLDDEDEDVRRAAAEELGQLEDVRAVKALIETCNCYDDTQVEEVLRIIAGMGQRAVPALLDVVEDHEEGSDVWISGLALVTIGDSHGLPVLQAFVDEHFWDYADVDMLLDRLVRALGSLRDKRAARLALRVWGNHRLEWEEAESALRSLSAWGVAPLAAALDDEDEDVAVGAFFALCQLGDPQGLEPVIAHLDAITEHVGSRGGGYLDLELLGNGVASFGAKAVAPLARVLGNTGCDWSTKCVVAHALGAIGDVRAVRPLRRVEREKQEGKTVQLWAGDALKQLYELFPVERLITALGDEDESMLVDAALGLGELGDDVHAARALLETLHDEEATPDVRYDVLVECVRRLKGPSPPVLPDDDRDMATTRLVATACLRVCESWKIRVFEMGFPTRRRLPSNVCGVSNPDLGTIEIDVRAPLDQRTKSLLREFAYLVYTNRKMPEHVQRFQAEAITFLTLCHFGISTLQSSAGACASYFDDVHQLGSAGTVSQKKVLESSSALIEELMQQGMGE